MRALLSAPRDLRAFPLTLTYMDVGNTEVDLISTTSRPVNQQQGCCDASRYDPESLSNNANYCPGTQLIREEQGTPPQTIEIPPELRATVRCEKTNLVTQMFSQYGGPPISGLPPLDTSQSLYGYIGTKDFTLFPLIRPGSFVQIDTTQKKVMHAGWSNEFDRPIYFVELRNGYACAWCELEDRKLLLVPCPQARIPVLQFRFPDDAGILGRVTAVSMRIAETRNDD